MFTERMHFRHVGRLPHLGEAIFFVAEDHFRWFEFIKKIGIVGGDEDLAAVRGGAKQLYHVAGQVRVQPGFWFLDSEKGGTLRRPIDDNHEREKTDRSSETARGLIPARKRSSMT